MYLGKNKVMDKGVSHYDLCKLFSRNKLLLINDRYF